MPKQCSYCGTPLTLAKRVKGEMFCSAEHRERCHQELSQTAFERVMNLQGMPAAESVPGASPAPTQTQSLVRLWMFAVAGTLAIAALGVLLFGPAMSKGRQTAAAEVRVPARPVATPGPVAVAPEIQTVPEPPKTAAATPQKSTVSIQATASSGVVACADGKVAFAKLFVAGTKNTVDFSQAAFVRTGNPAATHIEVNGKAVDTPVSAGGIGVLEVTPDATHARKGGEPDDCTKGL